MTEGIADWCRGGLYRPHPVVGTQTTANPTPSRWLPGRWQREYEQVLVFPPPLTKSHAQNPKAVGCVFW